MGMDVRRSNGCVGTRVVSLLAGGALVVTALLAAPAAFAAPGARLPAVHQHRLPAAVPEQPLHGQGQLDARPASGSTCRQAAMPKNERQRRDQPQEYEPQRRLQPRQRHRRPGARPRQSGRAVNKTNPAPLTDMSQALKPNAPIVVIDAATGKRRVIWAELDSNASDAAHTTLLIHPAQELHRGASLHRRDAQPQGPERRQAPGPELVREAPGQQAAAGGREVAEGALQLDLQVARQGRDRPPAASMRRGTSRSMSRKSLSSRMLQIRNNAFGSSATTTSPTARRRAARRRSRSTA